MSCIPNHGRSWDPVHLISSRSILSKWMIQTNIIFYYFGLSSIYQLSGKQARAFIRIEESSQHGRQKRVARFSTAILAVLIAWADVTKRKCCKRTVGWFKAEVGETFQINSSASAKLGIPPFQCFENFPWKIGKIIFY